MYRHVAVRERPRAPAGMVEQDAPARVRGVRGVDLAPRDGAPRGAHRARRRLRGIPRRPRRHRPRVGKQRRRSRLRRRRRARRRAGDGRRRVSLLAALQPLRWAGARVLRVALARRLQARSIHWSPYDHVGVVNADP
eukprot:1819-Pelagococcus_subviridis.AAC.1